MKSNDNLTKELLLESVSKLADLEIAQHQKFIDETGNLPEGLFAKMVNFGFLSLTIPKEYGGSGFDYDIAWEVVYEISKRSASIGCILEGHYKTIDQIKRFASDRLKEEFLPQGNQRIFGFSSTEPSGGTNVRNMRTEAFYQDNHQLLNGSKVMITNGGLAEVYCVIAKTEENEFSCVLVDMNMPGFEFGARENFMGLRGCPLGTLFFDNIRVPEYHLLGQRGQGMMIGDFAHYDARIYMGGLLAGAIKHGMDIAVSYALRRKTGSVQLPEIFPIQEKISNIAITHKNILLLTNEAFRLRKCHKDYSEEVATMIKAYGSKAAFGALEDGIQILDGYGYSKEYPIEYILRDVRALQLMEGSYEKMMYEISEEVTNEYK